MKLIVIGVFLIAAIALANAEDTPKKSLQIGIKKRAENCNLKSKKGDTLHM